jgi:hypothetical protein
MLILEPKDQKSKRTPVCPKIAALLTSASIPGLSSESVCGSPKKSWIATYMYSIAFYYSFVPE